jgi:glycosyltransferase involved in cell wall biosynthesis
MNTLRNLWYDVYEKRRLRAARMFPSGPAGRVSVIIPTYNRADMLESRALPSVLNQTYEDLQVIIADHGSTDRTSQVIYNACYRDHRVVTISVPRRRHYPDTQKNRWYAGPVHPLNAALKEVYGEFIARLDDDDEWYPDHIEKSVRFLRETGSELVSCKYLTDGGVVDHDGEDPPVGGIQTVLYRSYLRFMQYNPKCWKNTWNKVNDTDLIHRFRMAGVRMAWDDRIGAKVLPRPGEAYIGLKAYLDGKGYAETMGER